MAKAKERKSDPHLDEIKKLLKEKKLIFGSDRVVKGVRKGTIGKVFICQNPKPSVGADIEHLAKIAGVEIVKLPYPNDELGTVCKKPFSISVLGILR